MDMTAAELLSELHARTVTVERHGEQLRVIGSISETETAALRAHKTELLALLRPAPARTYPLYTPPANRWGFLTDADIEADRALYDAFIERLAILEETGMDRDSAFRKTFRQFDGKPVGGSQ